MFPIVLNPEFTRFLLVGNGELADKRLKQLSEAGAQVRVFNDALPTDEELKTSHIVYIVDLEESAAIKIAETCRQLGVLVNIEDVVPYCDFHTPSMVRRGDLLFSISTNGKSPGLAVRLRKYISNKFGPEWAERLEILAQNRQKWRSEDLPLKTVAKKTEELIEKEGWLP